MIKVHLLLILLIMWNSQEISSTPTSSQSVRVERSAFKCDNGYEYVEEFDSCLKLSTNKATWEGARDFCVSEGGTLAVVDTAQKQNGIKKFLEKNYNDIVWIGFNDIEKNGKFSWVDGTPFCYSNWGKGEPSNDKGEEHCGSIWHSLHNYEWNDFTCHWDIRFVCQKKNPSTNFDVRKPSSTRSCSNIAPADALSTEFTCDNGYQYVKEFDSCLKVSTNKATWEGARDFCVSEGGTLAVVDTEQKQNGIKKFLGKNYNDIVWIGFNDMEKNGHFTWVDGTPFCYANWGKGEPSNDNGTEHCGTIWHSVHNYEWNDFTCHWDIRFVCQKRKPSTNFDPRKPTSTGSCPNVGQAAAFSKCGESKLPKKRIVGGRDAELNKYPWVAAIQKGNSNTPTQYCGGVLISNKHVLTAAHCLHGFAANDITVRLGEHSFSTDAESQHEDFKIAVMKIHENYDSGTQDNDIALITLNKATDFNQRIWPICLPPAGDSFEKQLATVIGWGRLFEGGPQSNILKEATLPIVSNAECVAANKPLAVFPRNVCALDKAGGKDSCQGDSGGPLMLQLGPEDRWSVIGVVSWGIGCGQRDSPGVYARVSEFLPWIKSNSL